MYTAYFTSVCRRRMPFWPVLQKHPPYHGCHHHLSQNNNDIRILKNGNQTRKQKCEETQKSLTSKGIWCACLKGNRTTETERNPRTNNKNEICEENSKTVHNVVWSLQRGDYSCCKGSCWSTSTVCWPKHGVGWESVVQTKTAIIPPDANKRINRTHRPRRPPIQ